MGGEEAEEEEALEEDELVEVEVEAEAEPEFPDFTTTERGREVSTRRRRPKRDRSDPPLPVNLVPRETRERIELNQELYRARAITGVSRRPLALRPQVHGYPEIRIDSAGTWARVADPPIAYAPQTLPHWQNTLGICCKCSATLGNFKDFSSLAPWRSERLNHWQFLERQLLQGKKVSAIYHCPLFSTSCFKIDWLHTMDLGVSCDTLGNLCWHLLPKFAGKRSDQVAALFLTMKDFYTRNNVETRLFNLTEKMIRSSAKTSPKLKTRAGETRALVPWAWEIAQTMLDQLDPFEQAIFFAIKYLHQAYQCLSKKNFQHQHFHDVCFKFLLQYQALEFLASEYTWYIKPKFHGMAELALAFDNPSMNWVYRDEEAGGTLARLGRSKGNLQTP